MPTVIVPDPSLVALVGPAGSGKSTFAARHFAAGEILSSDAFRALITGDERDQRATRAAFGALHRELRRRLLAGRLTVVDATSVEHHARRALLRRAREAGLPAVAIVLDFPASVVLARNAARSGRQVDPDVVRRHLAALRDAVGAGALEREGWSRIVRIREPAELDAVRIKRRATPGPRARDRPTPTMAAGPARPATVRTSRRR
jgi:predicted kinase